MTPLRELTFEVVWLEVVAVVFLVVMVVFLVEALAVDLTVEVGSDPMLVCP